MGRKVKFTESVRRKSFALLLYFSLIALSCGVINRSVPVTATSEAFWHLPSTFQEADLIGTWEYHTGVVDYTDTLILMADKTFEQVFNEPHLSLHFEGHGNWWVEYRPSGCVYLHVEGMRYYGFLNRSDAEAGNRFNDGSSITFFDRCENRVITMLDTMILAIARDFDFPERIQLLYMPIESDSSWIPLHLINTPTPDLTPTSSK